MKNYGLTKEESNKFITNFLVYKDIKKITIVYGDGHNTHLDNYTPEDVDNLLKTLEKQVQDAGECKKQMHFQIKHIIRNIILLLIGVIFSTLCLNAYNINPILIELLGGLTILGECIKIGTRVSTIRDINKNQIFLQNKESIIESLKQAPKVLMNTSKHTQEHINTLEKPISINDLDEISPYDMNKIVSNIEELKSLGYVSPEREDKPYVIRPKK